MHISVDAAHDWLTQHQEGLSSPKHVCVCAYVQGLSFVCSSRSVGDQEAQARAEGALLSLLCHPLPAVSLAAYGMLERLVSEVLGFNSFLAPCMTCVSLL